MVNLAINEGAQVVPNVYGNVKQDIQNNNLSPSSFVPTINGQSYLDAAGDSVLPSFLGPIGGEVAFQEFGIKKIIGSSIGIGVGATANGEIQRGSTGQNQTQIFVGGGISGLANYGASQIIGSTPGRDVQGINSNFFVGSHMQNEIQTTAVSQSFMSAAPSVQSGFSAILSQLSSALSSLSALLTVRSAK